jgi:putative ABC transport system permease protein
MMNDLRYALRMLAKTPGFTAVAVLTLALGIGANSAIFSVVNTLLFHALPYPHAERLVRVQEKTAGFGYMDISYPNFLDWASRNDVFESQTVIRPDSFTLMGAGEPERIRGVKVSSGMLTTLGVNPARGRGFLPADDRKGAGPTVILSDGLWRRRFGGDSSAIGRTIRLDSVGYTVIGVMPPSFKLPLLESDLMVPLGLDADMRRGNHYLVAVARLKSGVTVAHAKSNLDAIAQAMVRQYPDSNGGWGLDVDGLQELLARELRPAMLILLGAVGVVLLIACANIANLLLARSTARRREFAIRSALGASRARLARQSFTESLVLALAGGGLGLLVASWGIDALVSLKPEDIPLAETIRINASVLGFTLVVSILTGLLFGLTPAIESWRVRLSETLKEGGRTSAGSLSRHGLRRALVISEIALSLVLAVGAALLIKSFVNVARVNPGFRPESVVTMQLALPRTFYSDDTRAVEFFNRLLEQCSGIAGASAVGAAHNLPLTNENSQTSFLVEGQPKPTVANWPYTEYSIVAGNYFQAMGIPLRRGRLFADGDKVGSPPVMIVDETLAAKYWPGQDPIGKRITVLGDKPIEVVGVVGHVKHYGLDQQARVESYYPFRQIPMRDMYLVLRTSSDPAAMVAAVRREVQAMDKDLAVDKVRTMRKLVADSMATRQFSMALLSIFAGLALTMAAIGIYGVMAYTVAQRSHEMGIRMALGAQSHDVLVLVVRHAMTLAGIGVAAGLVGSFAVTRALKSLLFGVSTTDLSVFAGISMLLISVSFLASYLPARRATRVDPMVALRDE